MDLEHGIVKSALTTTLSLELSYHEPTMVERGEGSTFQDVSQPGFACALNSHEAQARDVDRKGLHSRWFMQWSRLTGDVAE